MCARGEAKQVVAAADQAARAAATPIVGQPRPQHTSVAIKPSEVTSDVRCCTNLGLSGSTGVGSLDGYRGMMWLQNWVPFLEV